MSKRTMQRHLSRDASSNQDGNTFLCAFRDWTGTTTGKFRSMHSGSGLSH